MLHTQLRIVLIVGLLITSANTLPANAAEGSKNKFYKAYYLEHAEGDFTAAEALYKDVAKDRKTDAATRAKAAARLSVVAEELASADFARLMPPSPLAYLEITKPGDRLLKLLDHLGLTSDGSLPSPDGGRRVAISPSLIKQTLGIKGAAVAITGFNPMKGAPSGVLVFHHGDLELIRGAIETGLPIAAKPAEPIAGFPTYDVEGQVLVTLTSRLVIASPERSQIENVIRRVKGELSASFASSGLLAEYAADRDDSLGFFMVNLKAIMPVARGLMAATGAEGSDIALADALVDLDSLESLIGQIRVTDQGIGMELALRLEEGHRSLAFNFLRTPAIDKDTLRSVPQGVAAFIAGALNEAPSRFGGSGATDGAPAPIVTFLDIGREFFANIATFALFVLPPDDSSASSGSQVPDIGLVLTVNDPSKSQALWTQILGVASLATGQGVIEGSSETVAGINVRSFDFPENVTVYFATNGHDVLITSSRSAMQRSINAKRKSRSVLDDPGMAGSLKQITDDATKAVVIHAGRCFEIAKQYMSERDVAEVGQFAEQLADTVLSLRIDHSDNVLRLAVGVTGLPEIGGVISQMLEREQMQDEARAQLATMMRKKDWDGAVKAVDARLEADGRNLRLLRTRFDILSTGKKDQSAATAAGQDILKAANDSAGFLNNFAWALLTEDRYADDYADLALKASTRSNDLTNRKNWAYLDTLALACFKTGVATEAVEYQKKAIEHSRGKSAKVLQESLDRYEAAVEKENQRADAATSTP